MKTGNLCSAIINQTLLIHHFSAQARGFAPAHHISAGVPAMKMVKPKTYPKTCFISVTNIQKKRDYRRLWRGQSRLKDL